MCIKSHKTPARLHIEECDCLYTILIQTCASEICCYMNNGADYVASHRDTVMSIFDHRDTQLTTILP